MRKLLLLWLFLICSCALLADAGVLLPRDKRQPDPAVLSLDEMDITVRIDNGDARVNIRQIFGNHTAAIEEGTYLFALPARATVSDFAVWDGPVRIPAVILERKRAEELYKDLKMQAIDPGLLQQGEEGAEEARRSNVFSAKIVPIPPYGTKRVELEYHEKIAVENLAGYFALGLKPDAYKQQAAGHLHISFEMTSAQDLKNWRQVGKSYPLQITHKDQHTVVGTYDGDQVNMDEDFVTQFEIAPGSNPVAVLTHRDPNEVTTDITQSAPEEHRNEPGYFEVTALLSGEKSALSNQSAKGKNVIALFDTSLSMQWEKLEGSYKALEHLLRSLGPADRFNLLIINSRVDNFQPAPVIANSENVNRALEFVKASRLRGGTNIDLALAEGLKQCNQPNSYLVIISDAGATRGNVQNGHIAARYRSEWRALPEQLRPRTFLFAVGDDANLPLIKMLAEQNGAYENALSSEPLDFKLQTFISRIGRAPVGQLRMIGSPNGELSMVYPLQATAYVNDMAEWVGRYQPRPNVDFRVSGTTVSGPVDLAAKANLAAQVLDHPQLPRLWARARVDALLAKIERDGEDQASVDEIVRLSRRYKFVTPYTSFLAAPRSLLRPRVIRPGDPVLRVHTDPAIESVIAVFPFGLIKPLRHLQAEDVWQTRFLTPPDMQDGTYPVRLILRDHWGHTYREAKTFVIASTTPTLKVRTDRMQYRRGELVHIAVQASQNTRTLSARLEGALPTELKWDGRAGASTGAIEVPIGLPPGSYRVTVTAEDIAHNIGTQEAKIEVLP